MGLQAAHGLDPQHLVNVCAQGNAEKRHLCLTTEVIYLYCVAERCLGKRRRFMKLPGLCFCPVSGEGLNKGFCFGKTKNSKGKK